jgi:hypothetical protein
MRVLITGGRGQLGRALQAALRDDEVFAPGHSELDVTDGDALQRTFKEQRPDVVIHAAAWTDTAACERDPARALAVNGEGSRLVAEACQQHGAAMVYVSSNEVFDGEKREPYGEDDEPNPINEYGRSKLEGERHVRAVFDRHYIVRTSWLYGPGRDSFPEKIVPRAREQGRLRLVTDREADRTSGVRRVPPDQRRLLLPHGVGAGGAAPGRTRGHRADAFDSGGVRLALPQAGLHSAGQHERRPAGHTTAPLAGGAGRPLPTPGQPSRDSYVEPARCCYREE